jgi:multicomponent Na+:H+ antiporter subunit A
LAASPWATPAAVLVIAGAITKSAQLPFHLWLPSAMEAPTPVSAYLHAATMVKAGLYLVARLGPLFADIAVWTPTLGVLGLLTMTWGSWMALRQKDLKALLAFSTVSQLGLILSLLAASGTAATSAGLFHLLNHAVFKGALFLLVGVIEHEAHTRDLMRLGPLRASMPRTHLILALAALSMAGVPPFGGFVSKELFLEHALGLSLPLTALALTGALLTAAYCFALVFGLAQGRGPADPEASHAHDPGIALLWGPALLVAGALALGFFPHTLAGGLVGAAARSANAGYDAHVHLALWHGVTPMLVSSLVAVAGGLALWFFWWQRREPAAPVLIADRVYGAFLAGLENGARRLTESYMSGLIWRYVTVPLALVAGGLVAVAVAGGLSAPPAWSAAEPDPGALVLGLGIAMAALGTAIAKPRLAAILSLGATGYLLALQFSVLGAPDLALTQLMVETVSVVLFLAVFVYLPQYDPPVRRVERPGHFALAVCFGMTLTGALYVARGHRVSETISKYFVEHSVPDAGGHNIVNVILVDFRGLDTMGEITVLGVAALACYAVIKLGRESYS